MAVFVLRLLLLPWERAVDSADDAMARRAYVDDLTFWKRAVDGDVVGSVLAALDATRQFERDMDWELH
eukprot:7260331-Lingulodinium_polyedra.AAC.1